MRSEIVTYACLAAALLAAPRLLAQRLDSLSEPSEAQQEMSPEQRAQLEQRVRNRIGEIVRRRLGLSDSQFEQLHRTNHKYEEDRRLLVEQERNIRMALRGEILRGDKADQGRVDELLDGMIKVQRQRIDLFEREQRDLKTFLTPVQRAKYAALQERVRRRVEQFRRRQLEGGGAAPGELRRKRWRGRQDPPR